MADRKISDQPHSGRVREARPCGSNAKSHVDGVILGAREPRLPEKECQVALSTMCFSKAIFFHTFSLRFEIVHFGRDMISSSLPGSPQVSTLQGQVLTERGIFCTN